MVQPDRSCLPGLRSVGLLNKGFRFALLGLGVVSACAVMVPAASAQNASLPKFERKANPDAQMLLEADELQYDDETQTVIAIGNVQIDYDGYKLAAQKVTYHRAGGRVLAKGGVQIVEPDGNVINAEEIDLTDTFRDGFVSSLKVETPDRTRFAADSAERIGEDVTVLRNGVYTACERCKKNLNKPPLWQIRAESVTIDKKSDKITYRNARFELFGKPIAWLPYFSHTDPSVKRRTGFLMPRVRYQGKLGYSVRNSFFINLAPNYDVTLHETYYSKQGFLNEAEWRHRLQNGAYSFAAAYIDQNGRQHFDNNTIDREEEHRFAIKTNGKFDINRNWKFGWEWLWQSDRNFSQTYGFANATNITNQIYLTGLRGKNFFDVRGQKFLIQNSSSTTNSQALQAGVQPVLDYNYIVKDPVAGGQFSYDVNVASIERHNLDVVNDNALTSQAQNERYYGLAGNHTRASMQAEWKSTLFSPNGVVLTPSLHGRVDGVWRNNDQLNSRYNPLLTNDSLYRSMPTAGLEIRYPLIASNGGVSHLFEPIAQVFASTDETQIGKFSNEDAHSLVFDTSNLFSRNKFSGYDRIEGGVRANIGFRYSASFGEANSLDIIAGQSLHLAGQNSFAQQDLVNAGIESGLETKRSDYVVSAQLNMNTRAYSPDDYSTIALRTAGRFDEKNLEMRRGEVGVSYSDKRISGSLNYAFIDAQPNYGFTTDRHQVVGSAKWRFHENWSVFGGTTFDIETSSVVSDSIGLAYDDSCFTFSLKYSESRAQFTGKQSNQMLTFNLGLRTIGDYSYQHQLDLDNSSDADDTISSFFN